MQLQKRLSVNAGVSVHAVDDAQFVRVPGCFGPAVRNLQLSPCWRNRNTDPDAVSSRSAACNQTCPAAAQSPLHTQEDDPLRPSRVRRDFRSQSAPRSRPNLLAEEACKPECKPARRGLHHVSSGKVHHVAFPGENYRPWVKMAGQSGVPEFVRRKQRLTQSDPGFVFPEFSSEFVSRTTSIAVSVRPYSDHGSTCVMEGKSRSVRVIVGWPAAARRVFLTERSRTGC